VNACDCPFKDAVIVAEPLVVKDPAVAVKLAVVAPAIEVTDAGTETFALLEPRAIMAPPAGAGLLKVTRQLAVPAGFSDAGVQLTAETWESDARVSDVEAVLPSSEAVICAELSLVNDPELAVKLAEVAPEAAVTDASTETIALLELSAIDAPEAGPGLLRVAKQVDVPPGFNVAGLQVTLDTRTGAVSVSDAEAKLPLSEAVICAELSIVTDPAVAVKLAVLAPAMTATDAGTATLVLLELSAIVTAEAGAGWLRVTKQVAVPLGLNEAGLQLKPLTIACG
jgi:hypothetical protein